METYKQKRIELSSRDVSEIESQLSCELGQVRAGHDSQARQDRIRAMRDELEFRKKGGRQNEPEDTQEFGEYPFEYRVAIKYQTLFNNAQRRNKEFSLTIGDVKRLMQRKNCAYTGIKMSCNAAEPNALTIDRLDPSKGYVKGNVYAVTSRANKMKNHLFETIGGNYRIPIKELMALCKTIDKLGFNERDL